MSTDLLMGLNRLTTKYGRPLTMDADSAPYKIYQEYAQDAGNQLKDDLVIGKVATGEYVLGKSAVTVEVSMLNESFGLMPDNGAGHLVGTLDVTAHHHENELSDASAAWDSVALDFLLHSSGKARLVYANTFEADVEEKELYALTGADEFEHKAMLPA